MRTTLFILAGCFLWAIWAVFARFVSATSHASYLALGLFAAGWFGIAAINMGFGIFFAGYGFREELPIFLLIFAAPVLFASLVKWISLK
jgi:hypothetical protein